MRRALVLFAFAGASPACTSAAVSPSSSPSSQAAASPPAPSPSRPSSGASVHACRATPSTVYGDEPVIFVIDAPATPSPADVELFDQQGHSLAKDRVAVPGQWRSPQLPSGDFRLQAGARGVACWVTVNRELPRDPAASQK